jgi:putative nucleotidyltransferase with HDIG domain
VHFAKRYDNNYLIYSFEPNDFFPDFSVGSTNLLMEVGGIIWYSNNPQYIGDSYKNSLFKIHDGSVYISLRNRITEMQDTNIIISQNISLEAKIFLYSMFAMLILYAVFNQLVRKIRKDFKLLKSEQISLEDYINCSSAAMSKQDLNSFDTMDKLVPVYKWPMQDIENIEFQFEENKKYKLLIEKFVEKIFLLLDAEKISNKKLSHRLGQAINAISKISELNDTYTAGHQIKVQELACGIAKEMNLVDEDIENISMAATIHDIGKIYVPAEILNKPGKITRIEYKMIQSHALHGFDIANEIDFPQQILTMILQHHERIDGSGYPQGLFGDDIIIGSRIMAVADVVEAMCSHRPYRQALGIDAALHEIIRYKGLKYDTNAVDACVKLFRKKNFTWKSD